MRIAVLGGGNGGYAAAADLSDQGHSVALWRRDGAAFGGLAKTRTIRLKDADGARDVKLDVVTADISEAVKGAELILLPGPAFAQDDIAAAIARYVEGGQVIFLPPGTFGSVAMAKVLRDKGSTARVAIAETGTLPWLARKHGSAEVAISSCAVRLPTGVFPACETERACAVIAKAFPSIHPVEDALSGALMNAGPIIHPPLILMNAGPLQHFDRWDIHNEGTQPAVRSVTDRLDGERIAVREALSYKPNHYPLRDHYDNDKWMYGDAHNRLVDSGDWREKIELTTHRYMREDVACGLAFLVSAADWAGVPAPTATGLLSVASAICGEDLRQGSRTLEGMGLVGLKSSDMTSLLHAGF